MAQGVDVGKLRVLGPCESCVPVREAQKSGHVRGLRRAIENSEFLCGAFNLAAVFGERLSGDVTVLGKRVGIFDGQMCDCVDHDVSFTGVMLKS